MIREKKTIAFADLPNFLSHEYPKDMPWIAFFKMWLDAKGYDYGDSDEHIVDGKGDGGIDAIAYPPHGYTELKIVVIQSKKYSQSVPEGSFNSFIRAVEAFRGNSKTQFHKWLNTVSRPALRVKYLELWAKRNQIEFVIVTSGTLNIEFVRKCKKLSIRIEDKARVQALYFDMARGKTPRPEKIKLRISGPVLVAQKNREHSLQVFSASLQSFADAFSHEKKNLFAGNVRYALPGKSEVKAGIKQTLDERPQEFAYFHNGITVVCKKIVKTKNVVTLFSPSIVNGAQTVSYIGENLIGQIPSRAYILVKAIEVIAENGFEAFETDVAMSSNTQNKVSLSDLSVIDPDLVRIERFFRVSRCFLERKKGDSPVGYAFLKINKDRLLQLFSALDRKTGPASTKDKQALYRTHAGRLFKEYAKTVERKRDAVFIAVLDKVIRSALATLPVTKRNKKKRRLSLSYFTIFAATCQEIKHRKMWKSLRQAYLSDGFENQYSSSLAKDVKKIAGIVLNEAKVDSDKNDTAYFKNREKIKACLIQVKRKTKYKIEFHKI